MSSPSPRHRFSTPHNSKRLIDSYYDIALNGSLTPRLQKSNSLGSPQQEHESLIEVGSNLSLQELSYSREVPIDQLEDEFAELDLDENFPELVTPKVLEDHLNNLQLLQLKLNNYKQSQELISIKLQKITNTLTTNDG